jgi:hypothetical protein
MNIMKKRILKSLGAVLGLALSAAFAAGPSASAKPNADQILRQACSKLAAARQFNFKAHRVIDAALIPGGQVAQEATVDVTVQRPDKVAAVTESKKGERRAYFDGRTFALVDAKMNLYSTVPMRTSIDGLVDKIDEKFGFTPPLAEFTLSDPYKEFRRQARTVSYLGTGAYQTGFLNLRSVEYYRLGLDGNGVSAELWVGVNDHLMKKLVATFVDKPGKPQISIEFLEWNLAAQTSAGEFTFVPPKGAMKIHMRATGEMGPARVKTETQKN